MINTIDLFAGCGGLTEGFKQSDHFNTIACVEWETAPCENLKYHLRKKWGTLNVEQRVLRFDIQRTQELLYGWNDDDYGQSEGLDALVRNDGGTVDLIIGGPPCQAYSIAGRIRDKDGMKNDYRNYLFESYLEIVEHYKPKAFVFENVPGMLSARPGDGSELIIEKIKRHFSEAGYTILDSLKDAIIDFAEYGVPQRRSRLVILGLNKEYYGDDASSLLNEFYSTILPQNKVKTAKTVYDALKNLPPLYPLTEPIKTNGKRLSHLGHSDNEVHNHEARFQNLRDIEVFRMLAKDIETKAYKYSSTDALKELYTKITGRTSNVHKYNVLRWDEPSNTIPAHLYKDGLRHIHPDSEQARSITVREAARLQTFPDDYKFVSGSSLNFKMIGNAVPPLFAKILAESIYTLLFS